MRGMQCRSRTRAGKLYGRGSTDDKAPVLSWLWIVESYRSRGAALPVNLKMVLEGMEESGSTGLDEIVESEAGKFLADVDYFCISDNYWLGPRTPCLTYGLRGMCYFYVEIAGPCRDLHSGNYGGVVAEPMLDLVRIMGGLVGGDGVPLIEGLGGDVRGMTEAEAATYPTLDFDVREFAADIGLTPAQLTTGADKAACLQRRWRYPSLSLHGIEGAFYGPGAKTVIPAKVVGKFSIRLVPDMVPARVEALVRAHIDRAFAALRSPNALKVTMRGSGAAAWLADVDSANFAAARAATLAVHGRAPDLTREGGSIPVALTFSEKTGARPRGCC